MKCSIHPDREAAGVCVECSQLFCSECLIEVNGRNYCRKHINTLIKNDVLPTNDTEDLKEQVITEQKEEKIENVIKDIPSKTFNMSGLTWFGKMYRNQVICNSDLIEINQTSGMTYFAISNPVSYKFKPKDVQDVQIHNEYNIILFIVALILLLTNLFDFSFYTLILSFVSIYLSIAKRVRIVLNSCATIDILNSNFGKSSTCKKLVSYLK